MRSIRSLLVLSTLLLSAHALPAQSRDRPVREGRDEIGLYYGLASAQEFVSTLAEIIIAVGTTGYVVGDSHGAFGPLGITFDHYASDLLSLGAELSYYSVDQDYTSTITGDRFLQTKNHYYLLMGRADLHWLTLGPVEISSGIGLGPGIYSQAAIGTDSTSGASLVIPAFQLSPLRFRVGGDIAGSMELGLGFRGIFVFGVNWRY